MYIWLDSLNSLCLLALEHKEIENRFGLKTFTCTCTYSKVVVKHNSHNFLFLFLLITIRWRIQCNEWRRQNWKNLWENVEVCYLFIKNVVYVHNLLSCLCLVALLMYSKKHLLYYFPIMSIIFYTCTPCLSSMVFSPWWAKKIHS